MEASLATSGGEELPAATAAFYRRVLEVLNASGASFLVGGAYAFNCYTGIVRHTKDLDIFIRRDDYDGISRAMEEAGYKTEMTYPHWLAKIHSNGDLIDLIFGSGNGIAIVDQGWFEHALPAEVLGIPAQLCPAEEMLWSKSFIMERERYDGADIAHLLRARGAQLDWARLLDRFDRHWRVLLSHVILFGFVYPGHRDAVPDWAMQHLLGRLLEELREAPAEGNVCRGTLLSREQYLTDIAEWGYQDPRLAPAGTMNAQEIQQWTDAIADRFKPS